MLGGWLDSMILVVFSNLQFYDFMIEAGTFSKWERFDGTATLLLHPTSR